MITLWLLTGVLAKISSAPEPPVINPQPSLGGGGASWDGPARPYNRERREAELIARNNEAVILALL